MKDFWHNLPKPIFALAPMEDVTDAAFRRLIARYGKPAVMFTEFTSADGLVLAPAQGQQALRKKLLFSESERPIVAQLFTASPERMEQAARLVAELGFDGIDINMGCPVKEVVDTGCGAALIKNPSLAHSLIQSAKKADLPVSVKTRIGYQTDELDSWLPELLAEEPAAITIHARTRKEMSAVPARWDTVARAARLRDSLGSKTLILGNGDVKDLADARAKVAETQCDGAMLGRAIYGNPWLFADRAGEPSPQERIQALIEHLDLFEELFGTTTNYATISERSSDMTASLGRDESKLSPRSSFAVMKKHFKAYISGWDGAKELRTRLMETDSVSQARAILTSAILPA